MYGRTIIAAGLAVLSSQFGASAAEAGRSAEAVAYQVDVAHSGEGSLSGFKGKLKVLWSENLGAGAISHPLIADGLVFVTVANNASYGTELVSLDPATGATVWTQSIGGTYFWSNASSITMGW